MQLGIIVRDVLTGKAAEANESAMPNADGGAA